MKRRYSIAVAVGIVAQALVGTTLADAPAEPPRAPAYHVVALPIGPISVSASVRATIDDAHLVRVQLIDSAGTATRSFRWTGQRALETTTGTPSTTPAAPTLALDPGAIASNLTRSSAGDTPGSRFDPKKGAWAACIWLEGAPVTLQTPAGAIAASALDANAAGDVVGAAIFVVQSGQQKNAATLWRNAAVVELDRTPAAASTALGVSASGRIVGWRQAPGAPDRTAILWKNPGAMLDLNTAIAPVANLRLLEAHDVARDGVIVALARIGKTRTVVLLTPIALDLDENADNRVDTRDLIAMLASDVSAAQRRRWLGAYLSRTLQD